MNPAVAAILAGLGFDAAEFATLSRIDFTQHQLLTLILTKLNSLGSGAASVVVLPFSSSIATSATAGNIFDITAEGDFTLANPSGGTDGKPLIWRVRQDATGGRAPTLGNKFRVPSSADSPLGWSTDASAMDIFAAIYNATDDKWDVVALVTGY